MEALLNQAITDLKALHSFTDNELGILDMVDKAAEEIAVPELEHYLKHELNREGIEIAKKFGIIGIPIAKEYGGLAAGTLITSLTMERLGQMGMGFGTFYDVQVLLGALTIQRWGTEMQKQKYLKPAAKGDKILAFGLTEPEAGSDPASMKTTYEAQGDKFVINGSKYLISNGSIADAMILFARSKGDKSGISAFIIDTKSPGFSVSMRLEEKIGLFTSDTAMLEFNELEVPKANLLGELGKGMRVAYSALLNGRIGIASGCIGIIDGSLNAAIERARERKQFGKPIGRHQLIQRHIAEIRQNLEMARWPTYFAAIRKDAYEKDLSNQALLKEIDLQSALAKKIASRLAFESADHAVQVFGGFGYSLLSPAGRLFCDSRVTRIYEGTDEVQELKIASSVLGDDFRAFD
jgi:alkylation response protein AidB-like acyl-CoA dehydrogenase